LGDKVIPEVERKIGIRAIKAGDEVFFECANDFFCGVIAVIVRRDKLLDVVGNLSVWSDKILPEISMRLMKTTFSRSRQAVSAYTVEFSWFFYVNRMPCLTTRIWPLVVAVDLGRYLWMRFAVSPGHVSNLPASMTLIQVERTGLKVALWRYFASCVRDF